MIRGTSFVVHTVVFFTFENCMPTVHLIIKGKVQGVFFRASAKDVADDIGVKGWVKNTEEGDVEVMGTGTDEQIQAFIQWCKTGPRRAVVTGVEITYVDQANFKSFDVIRRS
jgi:acylphosphatase